MIEVEIEADGWAQAIPDVAETARRAAEAALAGARSHGDAVVLLEDDAAVRALNARFRGKDAPTNVLSFPAPESARPHLGDVVLAYGVCAREAADQRKPLAAHLSHLVAHGVLHLLGFDHGDDAAADEMESLERRVLEGLGIADPYAER